MRYYLKLIVLLITISVYSQKNPRGNYDVYIYINKNSNAIINQSKSKDYLLESLHLNWPKSLDYKKMSLIVNEKNELLEKVSISGTSNNLFLNYVNNHNTNPSVKIKKNSLTNIIKYEDFIYYDVGLLDVIKNAKNIYVILEKDKKRDCYFAKKVDVIDSKGL